MKALRSLAFMVLFCALFVNSGLAQSTLTGTITTYAGPSLPIDGAQAIGQPIDFPEAVVPDTLGGFYVVSHTQNRVYYVSASGALSVKAGTGSSGFSGDDGPATAAQLNGPSGAALDRFGNLYISDTYNGRIRKVTTDGLISTVVGTGFSGFNGDNGPATAARIFFPFGLAIDAAGNLFIADEQNQRIRKVTADGIITTVAGNGSLGFSGDGGPATSAQLQDPWGVAVDATTGNLFIADAFNNRVRKVTPDGVISTVAGTGGKGFSGDGGPAVSAQLSGPDSVAIDGAGNLYIADTSNARIRKVALDGSISTVAGNGLIGVSGDGGVALAAQLYGPSALAFDTSGNLLIADTFSHRIRTLTPTGLINTVAGGGTSGFAGDGGPATSAQFNNPQSIATDPTGNVFIADANNNRVRKITPDGLITTVAGTGIPGFSGDGGPASSAQLRGPYGVATDSAGNLFIADTSNLRVRKVSTDGIITTVAGIGAVGFSGDGGPAILARLSLPRGIAVDSSGTLFISDAGSNRVRKVTSDGVISTIAGNGAAGFSGDGGPATSAALNFPWALAADASGNLYIGDSSNYRVRKVSRDGLITTVAGNGIFALGFDGDVAASSGIGGATGLAVDAQGNLLVADELERVRKIVDGILTTVAGSGFQGFSGDGGPATSARLTNPYAIALDATGNLFIADGGNQRIRKVTFKSQTNFATVDRGGQSFRSSASTRSVSVGYATVQPAAGSSSPSGLAIFGFRQNNVLVTEAGVPASPLIQAGRIYAEVNGPVNTGLAIANPNDQPAIVYFFFTDASGMFGSGSATIPARGQIAAFLDQFPFTQTSLSNLSSFSGTFTFSSTVPVSAIALRGFTNERAEFLITTLPVTDLNAPAEQGVITFAHFADGGGWTTQIALVNPGDGPLTGSLQFLDQSGHPSTLTVNGQLGSTFVYSLAPRSSQKLQTSGIAASILTGSVRVTPDAGNAAPSGLTIFSFHEDGITVAEAGVPAIHAGTAFRLYAQVLGDFGNGAVGSIQTGLAVANSSGSDATVTITLTRLDGSSTGLTGTLSVPANGQTAVFLNQIPGLGVLKVPFEGVLRLSSTAAISVVGLRGRYNERKDFLITTTPPVNESAAAPTGPLYFPHIADGGGYTTQFILFSGQPGQSSSGTIQFFSQSGGALGLTLQ